MRALIYRTAMAVTTVVLAMGRTPSNASTAWPSVHKSGTVEILSGGIGQDASNAIEREHARTRISHH